MLPPHYIRRRLQAELSPRERASLERLERVRQRREPFRALAARLVHDTLDRYLSTEGRVIEIGSGDGQLRERLPDAVLARCLHTEPQAALAAAFAARHPGAALVQASAETLPVADGEMSGALGLCVLDVVPDGAAVARELARVLRPGGSFVHFLDMSTVLSAVVSTAATAQLVVLPNIFSEPLASEWPEDLVLVSRRQLELIVAVLAWNEHALAEPLSQYLAVFSGNPLAIDSAVAELIQLQESSELRESLKVAFRFAHVEAEPAIRQQLASFQVRPVSSSRHFEQRLRHWFTAANGFRVEHSVLARGWQLTPKSEGGFTYMGCSVGEQRLLPYRPDTTLCADAPPLGEMEALRELGVFVFVASRI